jgi:hypothetical protein
MHPSLGLAGLGLEFFDLALHSSHKFIDAEITSRK